MGYTWGCIWFVSVSPYNVDEGRVEGEQQPNSSLLCNRATHRAHRDSERYGWLRSTRVSAIAAQCRSRCVSQQEYRWNSAKCLTAVMKRSHVVVGVVGLGTNECLICFFVLVDFCIKVGCRPCVEAPITIVDGALHFTFLGHFLTHPIGPHPASSLHPKKEDEVQP